MKLIDIAPTVRQRQNRATHIHAYSRRVSSKTPDGFNPTGHRGYGGSFWPR